MSRHRFVLSFGYELPGRPDRNTAMTALLGGWQVNGIIQGQTGFPLTVYRHREQHPVSDEPSQSDLRSERGRRANGGTMVQYGVLRPPPDSRNRATGLDAARQRPRTGIRQNGSLVLQERVAAAQSGRAAARRGVQHLEPGPVPSAESGHRHGHVRPDLDGGRWPDRPARDQVQLLRSSCDAQ